MKPERNYRLTDQTYVNGRPIRVRPEHWFATLNEAVDHIVMVCRTLGESKSKGVERHINLWPDGALRYTEFRESDPVFGRIVIYRDWDIRDAFGATPNAHMTDATIRHARRMKRDGWYREDREQ